MEEEESKETDLPMQETSPMEEEGIFESEFEFYDPDPLYYHAVNKYLGNYLDGSPYNFSLLADIITGQPGVGTMVGCEEEEIENSMIRRP